jgi:SNF2 family DNA or RNA helicase
MSYDDVYQFSWTLAIFDEGHILKNPRGIKTKKCKELPIDIKIGLTGTLIQNNYKDLWSVFDVFVPGIFQDWKQFHNYFELPIQ